jgi:hypothetical protein
MSSAPICLDTNVLSAYLLRRPGAVALIDPLVQRREAKTSILIYGEITEYFRSLPNAGNCKFNSGGSC